MAYYNYYQSHVPYWGQQQYAQQLMAQGYQFAAPPVPTYQPQPSWTGQDYYQAHYRLANGNFADSDVGLFDYVWSRLRSLVGGSSVGPSEARHWHRRIYGGMIDIGSLPPADLGAAAGYEAYRLFTYHRGIYRTPLADDRDREEEALAGLAIAEATKLWSYCQRPSDRYGRRETCEVAAATAERLFRRDRRRGVRGYHRRGSISSAYGDDYYDDSYLSDDDERYSHYGGRRRLSTGSTGALIPSGFGAGYGSYPQLTYAGQQVGYPTAGYPATSAYGYQPATVGGGLMVPHARSRASSFSYAGSPGYMY